jgi:hypothetical protein
LIDNPDLKRPIDRQAGKLLRHAEQADKDQVGQQRKDEKVADLRMLDSQHSQPAILNLNSYHVKLQ